MRKYLLLLISGLLILGVLGAFWIRQKPQTQTVKVEEPAIFNTRVILDFGEEKKETNVATTSNTTAFKALEVAAGKNNLELKTKQYDFGIFVEGIGGVENTKDKAWIYFVNGKSADVAADKYSLKPGDVVEWKYIKPSF